MSYNTDLREIREIMPFLQESERQEIERILAAESLNHPVDFVRTFIGADPTFYQEEILDALVKYRRVAVRSPHGAGKSALSSWAVLFGIATFGSDFKIVTTASSWRQLTKFLWPEIHKWSKRTKWDYLGIRPEWLTLSAKVEGGEAFAVASDRPELIEGAHAEKIMYVLDEAKAIPDATWDAIEGAFSTGEAYALAISTPGDRSGRFFQIHQRQKGYQDWFARHVTLEETIKAGRVSEDWAKKRKEQWGADSPMYKTRVLGEFPDYTENTLIPLSWVEKAVEKFKEDKAPTEGETFLGLDVARYGADDSSAVVRQMNYIHYIETWSGNNTVESANRAQIIANLHKAKIIVDEIGVGAGVIDTLRTRGVNSVGVNVSDVSFNKELYANLRAELYWNLREKFRNGLLAIPENDRLMRELTTIRYKINPKGQIVIESKEDMKKRGVASPDVADALALSFAPAGTLMLAFA